MKFLQLFLLSSLFTGSLAYLIGALCAWDYNPANWSDFGRGFLVVVWFSWNAATISDRT